MTDILSDIVLIVTLALLCGICVIVFLWRPAQTDSHIGESSEAEVNRSFHTKHRLKLNAICLLCPVVTFGLYLLIGNPFIPSAPAAFEKSGPGFEFRKTALKEREILKQMAQSQITPSDQDFIKLASVQIEQGDLESAKATLQQALIYYTDNPNLREELGLVFYMEGLAHKIGNDTKRARMSLEKALTYIPAQSQYKSQILQDLKILE